MFGSARIKHPTTVNLFEWLTSDKYFEKQQKVRSIITPEDRQRAKQAMPCISPSGIFTKRGKKYLQNHTGLISIDIDSKDNTHISNFDNLKKEVCKISNVAYCGLSVSGKGYWLLIPITYSEKHEDHFRFIEQYFKSNGVVIDHACKDISRLRFYSYDPDAYFNHAAKPLQSIFCPSPARVIEYKQKTFAALNKAPWDQYNESNDFMGVLEKHGWHIESRKGTKTYFTRPGKDSGISAEFDSEKKVFYVFTTESQFEASKGYNPFQIYTILEHGKNFTKASKALRGHQINPLLTTHHS